MALYPCIQSPIRTQVVMNEKKHIALAADYSFSVPLALSLLSLQNAAKNPNEYSIHLLDGGVDRNLLKELSLEINYYDVSKDLRHLHASGRFPNSIYYRYLLPEILPSEIERVFYMDVDTMVCSDLSELWDFDMKGCIMAACPWMIYGKAGLEYKENVDNFTERFSIAQDNEPYFYSSMLMMDLNRMREEHISQQLIHVTEQTPASQLLWPDQDILNLVLRGRIACLPLSYNVIPLFAADISLESEEAKQAYANPHIVHFAATKPNILTGPKYPFEEEFFSLWRKSRWCKQIPYPLVSTYGMGKWQKRIILAPIKIGISSSNFLRFYGKCLKNIRAILGR